MVSGLVHLVLARLSHSHQPPTMQQSSYKVTASTVNGPYFYLSFYQKRKRMSSYVWRLQKKTDILCYECLGNFNACPLPPNKRFKGLKISDEYGRSDSGQV